MPHFDFPIENKNIYDKLLFLCQQNIMSTLENINVCEEKGFLDSAKKSREDILWLQELYKYIESKNTF